MGTYVYGIADRSHPGLPDGITGVGDPARPVRTVVESGLTAVVSDAPEGLRPKRRDLMAHQRVLYRTEEGGPVLPMRFGSVAPDDESVRGVLAERGAHFHERLRSLAGKVEYNVKATHREDAVLRYVMARRPDIRDLSDANNAAGGGNYQQRLQLGELVVTAVQTQQAEDAALLHRTLEPTAASAAAGPDSTSWLANVSFLVDRKETEAFTAAISQVRTERPHLELRVNGPLPPYSFVEPGPAGPAVPDTSTGSVNLPAE